MTTLFLPVGLPACGKSTLRRHLVRMGVIEPRAVVCPDELRGLLTGDERCMDAEVEVWDLVERITTTRLSFGRDVWLDATNIRDAAQLGDDRAARALFRGARVVWVVMSTPASVCVERNLRRSHPVPDAVMLRMAEQLATVRWGELPGEVLGEEAFRREFLRDDILLERAG